MGIRAIQEKSFLNGRRPYEDREIRCVIYKYKSAPTAPYLEIKFTFGKKCDVATNYNIGVDDSGRLVFFPDKRGFKVSHKNGDSLTSMSAKLQPATIKALPNDIKERLNLFNRVSVAVSLDKQGNLWIDGVKDEQ